MDTVTNTFVIPELDDMPDESPTLWTDYELKVLTHYHTKGPRAIQSFLIKAGYDRTVEAVRNKIRRMKVDGSI